MDLCRRFEFHQHEIFNQHVNPIPYIQDSPFEFDGQFKLSFYLEPVPPKFVS